MLPADIPPIGLGTAGVTDPELIADAIESGYRFIDTAQHYENEAAVGAGIDRASVDREELVLATKVHHEHLAYDDVLRTTDASLDRLGVESVDLLYVHWPLAAYDPPDTWRAFDEAVDTGRTDAIGVCNFTPALLKEAMEYAETSIDVNQVEMHPLLPQRSLRAFHDRHDIATVAFGPLMVGEVFEVPAISRVASEHGVSEAQVSLAWIRSKGAIPIPRGDTAEHQRDNLAALDLTLKESDLAVLDGIEERRRVYDNDEVW